MLKPWWVPKSMGMRLLSWEADVRAGGAHQLEFEVGAPTPMAFFDRYLEVAPHARLVWTNEESPDGSTTTVTFEERAGETLVTLHERYPSKEALEANFGATDAMTETLDQLEALVATLG